MSAAHLRMYQQFGALAVLELLTVATCAVAGPRVADDRDSGGSYSRTCAHRFAAPAGSADSVFLHSRSHSAWCGRRRSAPFARGTSRMDEHKRDFTHLQDVCALRRWVVQHCLGSLLSSENSRIESCSEGVSTPRRIRWSPRMSCCLWMVQGPTWVSWHFRRRSTSVCKSNVCATQSS
jgi:hypothetical protein